jgi:hypothetical protein
MAKMMALQGTKSQKEDKNSIFSQIMPKKIFLFSLDSR